MRCICCDKLKHPKDKGRTVVEPNGLISVYCSECEEAIWPSKPDKIEDLLEDQIRIDQLNDLEPSEDEMLDDDLMYDIDRYD